MSKWEGLPKRMANVKGGYHKKSHSLKSKLASAGLLHCPLIEKQIYEAPQWCNFQTGHSTAQQHVARIISSETFCGDLEFTSGMKEGFSCASRIEHSLVYTYALLLVWNKAMILQGMLLPDITEEAGSFEKVYMYGHCFPGKFWISWESFCVWSDLTETSNASPWKCKMPCNCSAMWWPTTNAVWK